MIGIGWMQQAAFARTLFGEQGAPKIDATQIVARFGFIPELGQLSFGDQRFVMARDFQTPLSGTNLSINTETGAWQLLRNNIRIAGGRDLGSFDAGIRAAEREQAEKQKQLGGSPPPPRF